MNYYWKEIFFCANRCILLLGVSAYVSPSSVSMENASEGCNSMIAMAESLEALCYCFVCVNAVLGLFLVSLQIREMEASFEMQFVIRLNFIDVIMFVLITINMVVLNFVYRSTCGELSIHLLYVIGFFWIIIAFSAFFGYLLYTKMQPILDAYIFSQQAQQHPQQQLQQQQQQNQYNQMNSRSDIEMHLIDI